MAGLFVQVSRISRIVLTKKGENLISNLQVRCLPACLPVCWYCVPAMIVGRWSSSSK